MIVSWVVAVAESAAVAMPHNVKGEALYCFVTLRDGFDFTTQLESELKLKGTLFTPVHFPFFELNLSQNASNFIK